MGELTIIPLAADVFGDPIPTADLPRDATGRTAWAARPAHPQGETAT